MADPEPKHSRDEGPSIDDRATAGEIVDSFHYGGSLFGPVVRGLLRQRIQRALYIFRVRAEHAERAASDARHTCFCMRVEIQRLHAEASTAGDRAIQDYLDSSTVPLAEPAS